MSFREGSGWLIIYPKPNLTVTFKAANHKLGGAPKIAIHDEHAVSHVFKKLSVCH